MSLQHIQKNSPRLLPKPAKFEKNPPNGYRVIRKTKCGAGSSPIHKQASLAGRLITQDECFYLHIIDTEVLKMSCMLYILHYCCDFSAEEVKMTDKQHHLTLFI